MDSRDKAILGMLDLAIDILDIVRSALAVFMLLSGIIAWVYVFTLIFDFTVCIHV